MLDRSGDKGVASVTFKEFHNSSGATRIFKYRGFIFSIYAPGYNRIHRECDLQRIIIRASFNRFCLQRKKKRKKKKNDTTVISINVENLKIKSRVERI